jgi:hypothetical protein
VKVHRKTVFYADLNSISSLHFDYTNARHMKFLEYNSDYVLPPVIPGFYYAKVSEMGGQTACYKNSKDLSFESNKENQHFASPFLSLLNSRLQYRQRKA